ncbi:hypothetical protein EJB05_45430 [Eragrostis curvula]|uniref:Uncharacterized protein n=1 Tax=Eragrostis curvula TaxID=38414 RepID=A0A5J9TKL8_9POAL|nr:hypothetical protein EJB05_45430 [Eragrostis curvula]
MASAHIQHVFYEVHCRQPGHRNRVKMRDAAVGRLLYVMVALLVVLLGFNAMLVECRQLLAPEVQFGASEILNDRTSPNTTTLNSTSTDESKFTLKFCTTAFWGTHFDFCCQIHKPEPVCYNTMDECQAKCPPCDPECPPGHGR